MASSAHADNGELPASIVVGTSAGTASQTASDPLSVLFGVPIGKDVNLATMHLHAGVRLPDGWLEPGVDVEMARGSGVESYAAFGDLRLHLGPSWRVHPTLLVGLGEVIEHGTDTMDVKTGARGAFMMGPGLQVRINSHWTATAEVRLMFVGSEDFDYNNPGTVGYYAAMGSIVDFTANAGATYTF